MSPAVLTRDKFDSVCLQVLDAAAGKAELTDHAKIEPAHLFLALVSEDGGTVDRLLTLKFDGLRAETVAASLREILDIAAPGDPGSDEAPDLLEHPCGTAAATVLRDAVRRATAWNLPQATLQTLLYAVLSSPDTYTLEAFGDACVTPEMLSALAVEAAAPPVPRTEPLLVDGEVLLMESFGPTAREIIRTLSQLGPTLSVEHLLIAALSVDASRTNDALHLMGLQPETIRRVLEKIHGSPEGPRRQSLEAKRLNRMLKGVFQAGAKLTFQEGLDLVGESQLIRSFVARVGDSANNLLTRLRINPERLRAYLESYKEDRPAEDPNTQGNLIQDVRGYLTGRVVGQEQAIDAVVPALQAMRLGMSEPGRLMGVFLFLGATGVGKTELAKAIADVTFGPKPGVEEPYLIRIDCGKLTERRDIVQLLGAPHGLVGYKEGALPNGLRNKGGRCVILFDEVEKADPQIWQSLLTFFDEGIVTEADGTRYDATGCILIATSNLGYKDAIQEFRMFDRSESDLAELQPKLEAFIWKRVLEYFSPEFRARFGRQSVLFFNHFRREHYRAMFVAQAEALVREMAGRGVEVTITPELMDMAVAVAWGSREEGARVVRHLVKDHMRGPVVSALTLDRSRQAIRVDVTPELEALAARRGAPRVAGAAPQDIEAYLNARVVNQEHAVRAIVPALKRLRAGLNEPGRLMGVFLFLGATGVGKTELARAIADVAFGSKPGVKDSHLILINCGVLKEPRDIVQVLGAPQGLVGYKQGSLTNGLRDKGKRCVILFDEVEKAHPQVWQSLLQLFDEGLVIEADGTQYDATGCVLIATSNLGYSEAIDKLRLFDRPAHELPELQPKLESLVWTRVVEYFSPELRGRFGRENVIFFNHFTREAYRSMVELQTQALIAEMAGRNIAVKVNKDALAALTDLAWQRRMEGARPVRRLVTTYIRDRVVEARAEDPECAEIRITLTGNLAVAHRELTEAISKETVGELLPYLNARVVGQEQAVAAVVPAVKRMRAGLNEPGRLMGSFLFLGPSGVGKTELAKAVADVALGPKPGVVDPYMIRIDCGKLTERRDIVQLLGAPQGLVGYKEGTLTNGLRDKGGRCVILFDEAEKACPHIWQSLLTFFDEGVVTEADGTRYDATGCVLIATSNLGYKEAIEAFRLFDQPYERFLDLRPQVDKLIWDKVSGYFSPEFLGRFGRENCILFNHFSQDHYRAMLTAQVNVMVREMQGRGFSVSVAPEVLDALTARAWEKRAEGARSVRRLVTLHLRNQIVDGAEEGRTVFSFSLREDGEITA